MLVLCFFVGGEVAKSSQCCCVLVESVAQFKIIFDIVVGDCFLRVSKNVVRESVASVPGQIHKFFEGSSYLF